MIEKYSIKTAWFNLPDKIRFVLIGSFNAGVSYIIFALICFLFGVKYYQISLALAWILSSFSSFAAQKCLVFNIKGNILGQYCKCCATWFFSYLINAGILELLVKQIKINVYLAQIIATLACAMFTYVLLKTFAFRRIQ